MSGSVCEMSSVREKDRQEVVRGKNSEQSNHFFIYECVYIVSEREGVCML